MINTKTVETLASVLKVDATKLSEQLQTTEADTSKQTTTINELIPELKVFTPSELETLTENIGKSKYNEGNLAGKEMLIKNAAKEYGFKDVTITDFPKLVSKVIEQEKSKLATPTDEVKALRGEKETLQQTVQQYIAEVEKWKGEVENVKTSTIIQSEVSKAMSEIQIEGDKANAQKEILSMAFMQKHQVKIEDGQIAVYKDGVKLKDNLQNPVSLSNALKEFAPSYVTLKAPTGREEGSSKHSQLNGDLVKITNGDTLTAYLDSKGIKSNSMEAVAILQEVRAKNPSFKL